MKSPKPKAQATVPADVLLRENDIKSALSIAYVQAIAAEAGYTCRGTADFDRDSCDVLVEAGGSMRPKLDLQLKASIRLSAVNGNFAYPLKLKNYNDLRIPTQTPRLLVVLDLPKKRDQWLAVNVKQLVLRRAAYWVSLFGMPETTNETSVTVQIPATNILDVPALVRLMEQSRTGTIT